MERMNRIIRKVAILVIALLVIIGTTPIEVMALPQRPEFNQTNGYLDSLNVTKVLQVNVTYKGTRGKYVPEYGRICPPHVCCELAGSCAK